jgi:hypothetical protein
MKNFSNIEILQEKFRKSIVNANKCTALVILAGGLFLTVEKVVTKCKRLWISRLPFTAVY